MKKATVMRTVAAILSLLLMATIVVRLGTRNSDDDLPSELALSTMETLRGSLTSRSLLQRNGRKVLTISSIKELAALQGVSNHEITLKRGVYVIDSNTKRSLPGGNWISDRSAAETGILNFSGTNNIWRFQGAEIRFNTEVLNQLPGLRYCQLVTIGGRNNVFVDLKWTHTAKANGQFGSVNAISGCVSFVHRGVNNKMYNLKLLSAGGRPYGFGSMLGKGGNSRNMFPGARLGKQSAYVFKGTDKALLQGSHIDSSGFGHVVAFQDESRGVVIKNCKIQGETRSTDDLRRNGINGYDRNGVPFNVMFNRKEYGAALGNGAEYMRNVFKPLPGTDACQSLGNGYQKNYVRPGYQFSLVEGGLRSYGNIQVTVINTEVLGVREGLSFGGSDSTSNMSGVTFRGLAGHGVPACAGAWNSNTPDNDSAAIQPSSNSVITKCKADSPFSMALDILRGKSNVLVDLEILDPKDGRYRRPLGKALAFIDGNNHAVRLEKKNERPLAMALKVIVGSKGATSNLLLCNLTKQRVELSRNVKNSVIYSTAPVTNNGSGNRVILLSSNRNEPAVCKNLRDGKRSSDAALPPPPSSGALMFNTKVLISGTKNAARNTIATMNNNRRLQFGGSNNPSKFVVRREPGSGGSSNGCVKWNDKIRIAFTTQSHNTPNCGWYGCRVARMDGSARTMEFTHGRSGESFYVRPRGGRRSSGCVSYGDEVFLAFTTQNYKQSTCGWYGCRVFYYVANRLGSFSHGRIAEQQGGIYFTKG